MSSVPNPSLAGVYHSRQSRTKLSGVGAGTVSRTQHNERRYALAIWLTLIAIFFPPILISLGGVNVTPGRFVVILLLIPAVAILLGRGRRSVSSDFFALAATIWIFTSSALNGGFRPYVGAEALEFLGAYLVGRTFFFGSLNFQTFARALRLITVVLVALAVLDDFAGRYITLDSFGVPNHPADRFGWVRAASVFEGAEHYGTFCVAAAAIFLYSERGIRRVFYVGLSFFGCMLSLSSGPFLGLAVVIAAVSYDYILKRYRSRWRALAAVIAVFIIGLFAISSHPIEWILLHLTLDPQTGFFRLATWNFALPLISEAPLVGHGVVQLGDSGDAQLFLNSIDSVWLLEALRYGLLGVTLLAMTMFSPLLGGSSARGLSGERTGLSLAIVAIAAIGLTVHFWDAMWLFLNLCVGIRASFNEPRTFAI